MHVITDPAQCPIKPSDINTETHFVDVFGHFETEAGARIIVRHCQEAGEWVPMSQEELDKRDSAGSFWWNKLQSGGWVIKGDDGLFRVTIEFVVACYRLYPAIPVSTKA